MASLGLTTSLNLRFRPISSHKHHFSSTPPPSLHLKYQKLSDNKFQRLQKFSNETTRNLFPSVTKLTLSPTLRGLTVKASAAAASASPAPAPVVKPQETWQGAAMKPLLASIATGVLLWFVPAPAGVSSNAWQLLSIFLATIVGIITQPLPLGAVVLLGLGACVLTKTLTFAAA